MLRFSRLRDAGVVAADEEDLVALQFRVAALGFGQQLRGGDQDAEGLVSRETVGRSSISHDRIWAALGISGGGKRRGESEGLSCCLTRRFVFQS